MSFENYLLSYRAKSQNTINRNSHAHPTFLESYQKIIEMIDWTLERYRAVIQHQNLQNNENDSVIINEVIEHLNEKKKFLETILQNLN
jgi:hypothetical protein